MTKYVVIICLDAKLHIWCSLKLYLALYLVQCKIHGRQLLGLGTKIKNLHSMKSIFVFLSASPAHWLPACWGSVNESGKRSSLYYCRQPAQPHSFPSLLQAREDPHCSPADGHTSPCQLRDGGRAHHALLQSQCTGCLHHTLAWNTKFAGALRLPVPDVSGSLTLPLAPMPVQTTLSNDSTGWWEEFVSEVCCNPPTSISYPRSSAILQLSWHR